MALVDAVADLVEVVMRSGSLAMEFCVRIR
jgi:hypothetical protein